MENLVAKRIIVHVYYKNTLQCDKAKLNERAGEKLNLYIWTTTQYPGNRLNSHKYTKNTSTESYKNKTRLKHKFNFNEKNVYTRFGLFSVNNQRNDTHKWRKGSKLQKRYKQFEHLRQIIVLLLSI